MENLTKAMAENIKLHQGEENLVPLGSGGVANKGPDYSLSLLGRVVVDRELLITSIRNNVLRLLHPLRGADIRIQSTNTFLIKFNHRVDRKNAMEGCPWAIERHALLLREIDPAVPLLDHVITEMKIIIKVHNFPPELQTLDAAAAIGANFGHFLGILTSGGVGAGQTFRMKVAVDVTHPLKRGFYAIDEQGTKCWYRVTYERLPMFCFLCGILGHGEVQCPTRYEDDFEEPEGGLPFGNWLRATGDNSQDRGAPLPLQAVGSWLVKKPYRPSDAKRGEAIFGVGKENEQSMCNQLYDQQSQRKEDRYSGSNSAVDGRRRIDPSKLKRKHVTPTPP